jgi:hypothetical protein
MSLTGVTNDTMEGGVMDAATWLARRREVAGNTMHVPQKRAWGVLESCEKRMCGALDTGVDRSHEVKPFVASITT